jgi:hypothetical protein
MFYFCRPRSNGVLRAGSLRYYVTWVTSGSFDPTMKFRSCRTLHFVKQEEEQIWGCGHACVAMLANVQFEDAVKVIGRRGRITWPKDIQRGLSHYGIGCSGRRQRTAKRRPNPDPCMLYAHLPDGATHWFVFYEGLYYDPIADGPSETYDSRYRVTSYMEIFLTQ